MADYPFHLNLTRKYILGFLQLFDDISVEKMQWDDISSSFTQRKILKVPIHFFSREKLLQILSSSSARKNMNLNENIAPVETQILLPRLAVNIDGIIFDEGRKLIKTNRMPIDGTDPTAWTYTPVPYNIEIQLSSLARTLDDSFQILEEIIPMFSPTKSIDIKIVELSESIPISLNSISFDFPTEVNEDEQRLYTVNYFFTIRANFYNYKKIMSRIQHIDVNFYESQEQMLWAKYTVIANTPLPVDYPNTPKDLIPVTESWI